jgi:hypothetical protein
MGKKENFVFRANASAGSQVDMLSIQGDDADAQQLVVTLGSPSVIPQAFSQTLAQVGQQNRSGEQDNEQVQSRTVFPGLLTPISWPPFEAILQWGVGGTSHEAAVDFINGSTINVTASFLRVFGRVVAGSDIDISGTSAIYTLSAFVGPGWVPSSAQKTIYVGLLPSLAESAVFAVPRFAKTAYVVGCDPSATPAVTVATLRFWQSPDGVAGGNNVGNFVTSGATQSPGFPVTAGMAYASVINGMGVSSRFSIVFGLFI